MNSPLPSTPSLVAPKQSYVWGALIWGVGWLSLFLLDTHLDLGNLSLLWVLISLLAAMCLPLRVALLLSIIFVFFFDWFFIAPRGTFAIHQRQDTLMLLVMWLVNVIVVSIMSIQRAQSQQAAYHAHEAERLREWSDRLHESVAPHQHIEELQQLLIQLTARSVTVMVLKDNLPVQDDAEQVWLVGEAGIEQRHALWYCTRNGQQLGSGTGRYEMFSDVYLPLRARAHALGAVLLGNFAKHELSTRIHLQAICDQFGHALERYHLQQQEMSSREQAKEQLVRNNLLAAISHDYRTPLATIMGTASSLREQTAKLDTAQQQHFAQRIYDEAERLNYMTHNILQLARLDADKRIDCDWQSAEEILADLIRRWRGRNLGNRLHIELQAELPLLWCDAILIGQLLENLVDNALKYSPDNSQVIVKAYMQGAQICFAVSDQGPGIDPEWRTKIFEPFQRGPQTKGVAPKTGAGVGLALCQIIAEIHGGHLQFEPPEAGGSCFLLCLPLRALPTDIKHE